MNKIVESLSKLLPETEVKDVADVINTMLEEAKANLESEYTSKLEEAYAELSAELSAAEKVAEQGYEEAYVIINDLRNRLEIQGEEYKQALEEGYSEAYEMLKQEQEKSKDIETKLHEEYDKKFEAAQEFMVTKIDQFLKQEGQKVYEQVKREMTNDPRIMESRVVLDKIVGLTSDYLSEDGVNAVSVSKLEEAHKAIEEMKGQIKLLEQRNIRLSTDNTKLTESVRQAKDIISEGKKIATNNKKADVISEQKERTEKSEEVTGRGLVTENVTKQGVVVETTTSKVDPEVEKMLILSGLKKSN